MSNNGALAGGAFITTLNGKQCTAVPKPGGTDGGSSDGGDNNNEATARVSAQINTAVLSAAAETTAASSAESTTSSSLVQITVSTPPPSTSTLFSQAQVQEEAQAQAQAQAGIILPAVAVDFSPDAESTSSQSSPSSSQSIPPAPSIAPAPSPASIPALVADPAQDGGASSIIASSEADDSNAATLATVATSAAATFTEAPPTTAAPTPTDGGAQLFTTIGTDDAAAAANTGPATNNVISTESPGAKTDSVAAVAGGVVGGVAMIGLVAFFVWFWRRRMIKRRRSTMLTPLDGGPGSGHTNEKGEYVINRGSIGPTPRAERIKASFDYNFKRIRSGFNQMMSTQNGGSSMSSVNMNRGNSQFMEDSLSRRPTNASSTRRPQLTTKDRLGDWWSRLTADANFNRRMRSGKTKEPSDPFAEAREKTAADMTNQPDFLTLLNMDERELEREAQKKRADPPPPSSASSNRSFGRRSNSGSSAMSSSALSSSAPHFLSDLNLGFGNQEDPFSDANALAHNSAKPAPLVASGANNPFSDANAIGGPPRGKPGGPNTYVADMRRSRGQSVGGGGGGGARQSNFRGDSVYRESVNSVDSFTARRNNKFRSDPFDLERPELLGGGRAAKTTSSNMSTAGSSAPRLSDVPSAGSRTSGGVGTGDIRRPRAAHQRSESFTSKYSSGFSLGDWSDPGPDVGPAAIRWGETGSERISGGSQGSVGKAL